MIDVVAAVIESNGQYLIARRAPHKHMGGHWEFPGGKIESDEMPEQSLRRELQEEFGINAQVGEYLGESVYDYGSNVVRLLAYKVSVSDQITNSTDHDRIEWVRFERLREYKLAPADVPLLDFITASSNVND